jgi:hypothetical protein
MMPSIETANNIWLTCYSFHNWSLEVAGLDGEWDGKIGKLALGGTTMAITWI